MHSSHVGDRGEHAGISSLPWHRVGSHSHPLALVASVFALETISNLFKKSSQLLKFTKADVKHWSICKKLLHVFLCSQKQSNLNPCDMLNTRGQSHRDSTNLSVFQQLQETRARGSYQQSFI